MRIQMPRYWKTRNLLDIHYKVMQHNRWFSLLINNHENELVKEKGKVVPVLS
jgi:hypothetical protein